MRRRITSNGGGKLHGAVKKDGGLRPIGVGNVLRRLVSKCSASAVSKKAAELFSPHQLSVGVKGGCEALVHSLQNVMSRDLEEIMIMQVDQVNAFNLADRKKTFEEVITYFPELAKWIATCYGSASRLVFGDQVIQSMIGFLQGDPLAVLLFGLDLHPVILKIKEKVPTLVLNGWFLDNGLLAGKREELKLAIDIILEEGPARGLILSTELNVPGNSKSTVWGPSLTGVLDPPGRGIKKVEDSGLKHLGAPVGSMAFVVNKIESRIAKVKELLDKLPTLKNSHSEFVLLRSCFSLPKVSYLLRTCPPLPEYLTIWEKFDGHLRDALNSIIGTNLSDFAWAQAQLPVVQTGLGLRSAASHSLAAYVSSALESHNIMSDLLDEPDPELPHINQALHHLSNVLALEDRVTKEAVKGTSQRGLSQWIDRHYRQLLDDKAKEVRDKTRLASLSLAHSGDWLNVVPSVSLGLQLRPAEFRVAVLYRLGMPIFQMEGPCVGRGTSFSDKYGDHAISCACQGERISRHNHLRDALYNAAMSAQLGPTREDRALLPLAAEGARPADVYLPLWAPGAKDAALDVTVVSPFQQATLEREARGPGRSCRSAAISIIHLLSFMIPVPLTAFSRPLE